MPSAIPVLVSGESCISVAPSLQGQRHRTSVQKATAASDAIADEQQPQQTFADLNLSDEILSAVRAQSHWQVPTPIQSLAIPQILASDSSIWCEAPTGSGKTAAFALPLLQKLYRKDTNGIASIVSMSDPRTRSSDWACHFAIITQCWGRKDYQVVVLHGGVPLEPQITTLSRASRMGSTIDVVVATPGRLVDVLTYYDDDSSPKAAESAMERRLLDALDSKGRTDASLSLAQINDLKLDRSDDDGRSSMRKLLDGVRYLVIDEADRLLGKAFQSEVDACLDLLKSEKRVALPTWLFSATFPRRLSLV
jgi:superfamily II DNA/RNA helicase